MLYSIGVSVGLIDGSTDGYFFADGSLHRMKGAAFRVWTQFMQGNDESKAIRAVKKHILIDDDMLKQTIEHLQTVNLLVNEEALFQHKPQHFGRGIGRGLSSETCTVYTNTAVEVSYGTYLIWCYCDGRGTLQEVIEKLNTEFGVQMKKEQVLSCIHELLRKNLIAFVE